MSGGVARITQLTASRLRRRCCFLCLPITALDAVALAAVGIRRSGHLDRACILGPRRWVHEFAGPVVAGVAGTQLGFGLKLLDAALVQTSEQLHIGSFETKAVQACFAGGRCSNLGFSYLAPYVQEPNLKF